MSDLTASEPGVPGAETPGQPGEAEGGRDYAALADEMRAAGYLVLQLPSPPWFFDDDGESTETPGQNCSRCNGTGVVHPEPFDVMADKAWADNRPDRYIAAIRDLRIADDDRERPLRAYKDAIDAAKERAGDG